MSRVIRAPGRDHVPADTEQRPNVLYSPTDARSGAGGVHAKFLQGATPKYGINNGERTDYFRNTLARMFVAVSEREKRSVFFPSLTDQKVSLPARALTGTSMTYPSTPTPGSQSANTSSRDDGSSTVAFKGYLDFFIQSVQMSFNEKVQISETLSDNYVAYAFGQSPPIWTFQGTLINTAQDDQASNMYRLYVQILRATQMARRQKILSIAFDSYVVNGVMMNMNMQLSAANELLVPFTFQLLVKRVVDVNTTPNWVPTNATAPFAADLYAIGYDGRPVLSRSMAGMLARTPLPTQTVTPTGTEQPQPTAPGTPRTPGAPATPAASAADPRTQQPPPAPEGPAQSAVVEQQVDDQEMKGWGLMAAGVLVAVIPGGQGVGLALAATGAVTAATAAPLMQQPETATVPGTRSTPGVSPQTPVETAPVGAQRER